MAGREAGSWLASFYPMSCILCTPAYTQRAIMGSSDPVIGYSEPAKERMLFDVVITNVSLRSGSFISRRKCRE